MWKLKTNQMTKILLTNISAILASNETKECKGMNTFKDSSFVCHCLPGFPFGDPVSEQGCYRCDQECHSLGYCAYPGKCKCVRGYIGDGITSCEVPIPEVTGIFPNIAKPRGYQEARITYYMEESFTPTKFYCKFGNVQVVGSALAPGVGVCTIPPSNEYAVRVSVTFDGYRYSNSDVFLRYEQKEKEKLEINWVSIIATMMVFIWGNIIVSQWSRNPNGISSQDENEENVKVRPIHAFDKDKNKENANDGDIDDNIL